MRILHLSDTHLTRAAGPNHDGIDTRESLRRILRDCGELPGLDVVLVTGDLADDGSHDAYRDLRSLVGEFALARGIPALFTTGNHDEREAFTAELGSGHHDATGEDRPEQQLASPDGERAAVTTVAGYRLVTLDSLVPGEGYGLITPAQLAWLRDILGVRVPTVLAFHHPPIGVPGVEIQHLLGLRNGAELADVIRDTDVRIVLCGHFHLQLTGMLAGVPVWVTPGVVNRIDLTAPAGSERGVRGASASLIDLGGPFSPTMHTLHARDPRAGETAFEIDAATFGRLLASLR